MGTAPADPLALLHELAPRPRPDDPALIAAVLTVVRHREDKLLLALGDDIALLRAALTGPAGCLFVAPLLAVFAPSEPALVRRVLDLALVPPPAPAATWTLLAGTYAARRACHATAGHRPRSAANLEQTATSPCGTTTRTDFEGELDEEGAWDAGTAHGAGMRNMPLVVLEGAALALCEVGDVARRNLAALADQTFGVAGELASPRPRRARTSRHQRDGARATPGRSPCGSRGDACRRAVGRAGRIEVLELLARLGHADAAEIALPHDDAAREQIADMLHADVAEVLRSVEYDTHSRDPWLARQVGALLVLIGVGRRSYFEVMFGDEVFLGSGGEGGDVAYGRALAVAMFPDSPLPHLDEQRADVRRALLASARSAVRRSDRRLQRTAGRAADRRGRARCRSGTRRALRCGTRGPGAATRSGPAMPRRSFASPEIRERCQGPQSPSYRTRRRSGSGAC